MTITVSNTELTDSFDFWRLRTNDIADALTNQIVTVDSNAAVGNAVVTGSIQGDILLADTISGGEIGALGLLTFDTNTAFTGTNVTISGTWISDSANVFLGLAANVQMSGSNATHHTLKANNVTNKLFFDNTLIGDIDDITISAVANGHILFFNDATSDWRNTSSWTGDQLLHGSDVDSPSSGVHGVSGSVVGTTDSQTLTNKILGSGTSVTSPITTFESTGIDDNATSHALTIDSSERVLIGATVPDLVGVESGSVTISTGDSGVADAVLAADDLIIENNTNAGITIATPNTSLGTIAFGDPDDNNVGQIIYDHSVDTMQLIVATSIELSLTTDGMALSTGSRVDRILDEDDMASNSASALATQQSIKAYADGRAPTANVQTFTTSGIWTKPTDKQYSWVLVDCIGGGGGGGGGRRENDGGGSGGGGAAPGGRSVLRIRIEDCGVTETVTIGAFGPGGAGGPTDNDSGDDGTIGGDTIFGNLVLAGGGDFGNGGQAATGIGGTIANVKSQTQGFGGATGFDFPDDGDDAGTNYAMGTGGGGGGGNFSDGGSGGATGENVGGTAGAGNGVAGGSGVDAYVLNGGLGSGGGGGAGHSSGNGGNGGNGGAPSGGGGGGGTGDGGPGGAGGAGARGECRVYTF